MPACTIPSSRRIDAGGQVAVGNVIEQGNHDQLMTQDGMYAGLYNSQFEAY